KPIASRGDIGMQDEDKSRQPFQGCSIRSSDRRMACFRTKIADSAPLPLARKLPSTNEPHTENVPLDIALFAP
ncbi:MAG: hypothetical protein ACK5PZ_06095, partial [Pirellula sp.]